MASPPLDIRKRVPYPIDSLSVQDDYSNNLECILITNGDIKSRIHKMTRDISEEYAGKDLTCVVIMDGALPFAASLLFNAHMKPSFKLNSMEIKSYHGITSGMSRVLSSIQPSDVSDRHVLIVEDIADTGNAMGVAIPYLKAMNPSSVNIAVLLDKPQHRINTMVNEYLRYVGFVIPSLFVVGFGLDYNDEYRGLPHIGVLKEHIYKREI